MLGALENVLSIILAIAAGFVLAKRGWFGPGAGELIPKLVVGLALPAYMVSNLTGGYDRQKLLDMLPGLPIPFAVMIAVFAIGLLLAALFRVPLGRRGVFSSMFALSNTIFVGLPVNLVLFGEESLPYVLLYYIANTSLFWTIGVYAIASDGAIAAGRAKPSFFSPSSLKRIFSPPLTAFLASVALIMVGVKLPSFLLGFCKTIGSMTTPLSMLFIGIVIAKIDWGKTRMSGELWLVLAGRFLVAPALLVLLARSVGAGLPPLMKEVFFVQAAMPAMTQTPILASSYGADAEFAGLGTALSTIACLATIPICMALVPLLF
jgi:malate permease and related proteins